MGRRTSGPVEGGATEDMLRKEVDSRMKRILRWAAVGGAVVLVLGALAWFAYASWAGFGPWKPLPGEPAPDVSIIHDTLFADAARKASRALGEHRTAHGFPGITAAVALDGELLWTGGAGWADLARMAPVSPQTVMRIGSTSKAVTATALARLLDRGRVSLDEPISTYSESYPNPSWGPLTLRQLSSHTAGFPGYQENRDLPGVFVTICGCRHYSTVWESLEVFDDTKLLHEPGTEFFYSSFDVNLVGAILARVEDEHFLAVLDHLVFEPLDLTSAGGDGDGTPRPDLARFYEIDGERARAWRPFDLSQRWPGGGLVATSEELARLGGAWLDPEFIRPETRAVMWTPQVLSDGEVNEQRYAIGWRFYPDAEHPADSTRTLPYAHHGGVSKGAMSWLVVYPDARLSIAVNINTRATTFPEFAGVEQTIAALFLEELERLGPAIPGAAPEP